MILVTGCSGFIGSHLVEKIKEPMVGIDVRPPQADHVKFYDIDILNGDLRKVFEENEISRVVHLAARSDIRSSENVGIYLDVNIRGLANILELSREYGVKQFIFASTSAVYGGNKNPPFSENGDLEPLSIYGITKRAGEMLCHYYSQKYLLPCVCLRFFTVYGEGGRKDQAVRTFTQFIDEGRPVKRFGDGTSKRDYIHVSDIVEGISNVLERDIGNETINLGTGRAVELNYLIELIGKNLGKKPQVEGMENIVENVETTCADISKAKKLLGWEPKISLEEGIQRFVEWYKENK